MKVICALLQIACILLAFQPANSHKRMTRKHKHAGRFGMKHRIGKNVKKFNIIAQPSGPEKMMVLMRGREGKTGDPGPQGDAGTDGLVGPPGLQGDKGSPGVCSRDQCESQELKALMMRLQKLEIYLKKPTSQPGPPKLCKQPAILVPFPCPVNTTVKPAVTIIIQGGPQTPAQPPQTPQQPGTGGNLPQQPGTGANLPQQPDTGANPPQQPASVAQRPPSQVVQPPASTPNSPNPQPTESPATISTPAPAAAPQPAPAAVPPLPPPPSVASPLTQTLNVPPPAPPPAPMKSLDTTALPFITINTTIQSPSTWVSSGNGQMDLQVAPRQAYPGNAVVMPQTADPVQYPTEIYPPVNVKKHEIPQIKHGFMTHAFASKMRIKEKFRHKKQDHHKTH